MLLFRTAATAADEGRFQGDAQHGFRIVPDAAGAARLNADGSYNTRFHRSAAAAAYEGLVALPQDGTLSAGVETSAARLGGLRAIRVAMRYRDPKSGTERVRLVAAALRGVAHGAAGIVYSIELDTTTDRFPEDARVFEAVAASLRVPRE